MKFNRLSGSAVRNGVQSLLLKTTLFASVMGVALLLWSTVTGSQPSADDFGFSGRKTAPLAVAGMSVDQVAAILSERMNSSSADQVSKLSQHLLSLCREYRFDPAFILSVIQAESGFKATAMSEAGAVGLMQLMPATAHVVLRDMNPPLDRETLRTSAVTANRRWLMDPFTNLTLGVAYLAFLRERYKELHPYFVLAAYNLGPARMDELLSKKTFKPDKTKKYFEAIRQGTSQFRSYRSTHRSSLAG